MSILGVLWLGLVTGVPLPVSQFGKIKRDSGRDDYYQVVRDDAGVRIAADYEPPMQSETFGAPVPEPLRKRVHTVRWRWRVRTFPAGGDDCVQSSADSAAGVFLTFHSGLKWILLKYIWSEKHPVGSVCDHRRGLFLDRDTIVLESGGDPGVWHRESIDPRAEYLKHFGGKPGSVPDFVGVGLFTDGDQTKSPSAADYADFRLDVDAPPN